MIYMNHDIPCLFQQLALNDCDAVAGVCLRRSREVCLSFTRLSLSLFQSWPVQAPPPPLRSWWHAWGSCWAKASRAPRAYLWTTRMKKRYFPQLLPEWERETGKTARIKAACCCLSVWDRHNEERFRAGVCLCTTTVSHSRLLRAAALLMRNLRSGPEIVLFCQGFV